MAPKIISDAFTAYVAQHLSFDKIRPFQISIMAFLFLAYFLLHLRFFRPHFFDFKISNSNCMIILSLSSHRNDHMSIHFYICTRSFQRKVLYVPYELDDARDDCIKRQRRDLRKVGLSLAQAIIIITSQKKNVNTCPSTMLIILK